MKQSKRRHSFRNRLFFSLVLTTVLSMILCAGLLILLFHPGKQLS